jgi:hypothetical protein
MFEKINDETQTWFIKIIIPALVAVSIKIALHAKKTKLSMAQVVVSFVSGIGSAYLFGDYVMSSYTHQWQPLIIAVVAISGEKIGYYIMTLNIDSIMGILTKFKK